MNKRLNNKQGKKRAKVQVVNNLKSLGLVQVMDLDGDIFEEEVNVYTLQIEEFFDVIEILAEELAEAFSEEETDEIVEENLIKSVITLIKKHIHEVIQISTDISEDSVLVNPTDLSKFLSAFLKLNNVQEILKTAIDMINEFSNAASQMGK